MKEFKEILKELAEPMDYKWRVQSFSKFKKEATCVAYIDARQAQDRLNEVLGLDWQDKYYELKGTLYCSIGVKVDDEWIWRSDCGVESNMEAQKGEASDAFKRACVKFGVGRFLYDQPIKILPTDGIKQDKQNPHIIDGEGRWVAQSELTAFINSGVDIEELKKASKESQKGKLDEALKEINKCNFLEELQTVWESYPELQKDKIFIDSTHAKKKKLVFKK